MYKCLFHVIIVALTGSGIVFYWYKAVNNELSEYKENINKVNKPIKLIDKIVDKQLQNIKEQLILLEQDNRINAAEKKSKINQLKISFSEIQNSNLELSAKKHKLMDAREDYKNDFIKLLNYITQRQSDGYIRYISKIKRHKLNLLGSEITKVNTISFSSFFLQTNKRLMSWFDVYEIPYKKEGDLLFMQVPDEFKYDIKYSRTTSEKGFAMIWNNISYSFMDKNNIQIQNIGKKLEETVQKLKFFIKEYQNVVEHLCETTPTMFGYSDTNFCYSEIYEPIKSLDY